MNQRNMTRKQVIAGIRESLDAKKARHASLVSAAPDMLEALRLARNYIFLRSVEPHIPHGTSRILSEIEAAIAKAIS